MALSVSLLLHALALYAFLVVTGPRKLAPPKNAIMTQLVRLGKPQPKEQLPRLAPAAPEPPAPAVVPAPAPAPAAVPVKAPAPVAKVTPAKPQPPKKPPAKPAAKAGLAQALAHMKEAVSGKEDGSPTGDADRTILGDAYLTEVKDCLQRHYVIEGFDPTKLGPRQAVVWLQIGADGSFLDFRLRSSTGPAGFDRAVQRAIKGCHKISAPPPELQKPLRLGGVEIVFTP